MIYIDNALYGKYAMRFLWYGESVCFENQSTYITWKYFVDIKVTYENQDAIIIS